MLTSPSFLPRVRRSPCRFLGNILQGGSERRLPGRSIPYAVCGTSLEGGALFGRFGIFGCPTLSGFEKVGVLSSLQPRLLVRGLDFLVDVWTELNLNPTPSNPEGSATRQVATRAFSIDASIQIAGAIVDGGAGHILTARLASTLALSLI